MHEHFGRHKHLGLQNKYVFRMCVCGGVCECAAELLVVARLSAGILFYSKQIIIINIVYPSFSPQNRTYAGCIQVKPLMNWWATHQTGAA